MNWRIYFKEADFMQYIELKNNIVQQKNDIVDDKLVAFYLDKDELIFLP